MTDISKPTVKELVEFYCDDYDDALFKQMQESSDTSWRHGCYMSTVFKRLSDETFWNVYWQLSDDHETNTFRDSEISINDITQVKPIKVTNTKYVAV
jgi:hypothetical protein